MMGEDLLRRLRQMGVVRGVRELATLPPPRRVAIEDLVLGHFYTTSHGRCFVAEATYPLEHHHGDLPLAAFLDLSPEVISQVARDEALAGVDLRRVCFVDTETTGLSGGAGTMAFVVGLGFFCDDGFCVQQCFLRDPGDEPAMIEGLAERLQTSEALASFNGRAFDVPILENRFVLARMAPPTMGLPHLDLLLPARRLWRYHLPSCRLGVIEQEVLGVLREQDDVPSGVIPELYRDYLRTGDARSMQRVMYHNVIDILSLVTLAVRLCRVFANPWTAVESGEVSAAELYGLARWYAMEDRPDQAERAYRAALARARTASDLRTRVLRELGFHVKRAGHRAEAFAIWQQLAIESSGDVLAHIELAKYLEWHAGDAALAAEWTRVALAQAETWPTGMHREDTLDALRHRLARLERKLDKRPDVAES